MGGIYAFSDAKSIAGPGGGMPGFPLAGSENAYVIAGSAKLMIKLLPFREGSAFASESDPR